MHRPIVFVLAPLAAAFASPAAASPAASPQTAFAAAPLDDAHLATIHGAGLARDAFLRRAARDEFEQVNRLTGATLPVIFDNWFADIGDALIISNQVR